MTPQIFSECVRRQHLEMSKQSLSAFSQIKSVLEAAGFAVGSGMLVQRDGETWRSPLVISVRAR